MKNSLLLTITLIMIGLNPFFCISDLTNVWRSFVNITSQYTQNIVEIAHSKKSVSEYCLNSISKFYGNNNVTMYFEKLFKDSAKAKNDIGSYNDCLNIDYNENTNILSELTYLIIEINKNKQIHSDLNLEENNYLFGVCFIKGCTEVDISNIIMIIDHYHNEELDTDLLQILEVNVIDIDNYSYNPTLTLSYFLNLIPLIILLLFIIFAFIPAFPLFFCKCCMFYQKSKSVFEEVDDAKRKTSIKIKRPDNFKENVFDSAFYYKIYNCISIFKNIEELFSLRSGSKHSPPGISHIKGLRAISIILLIYGYVFFILFNTPLKISSEGLVWKLINSIFFSFTVFGLRFTPMVLYAISGYLLVYKMFHYLDDYLIHNRETAQLFSEVFEKDENQKEATNKSNSIDKEIQVNDIFNSSSSILIPEHKVSNVISFSAYVSYLLLYVHKYLIFILSVLFFNYSLYYVVGLISDKAMPLWTYFYANVIGYFNSFIVPSLFLFDSVQNYELWSPYSIVINEILFFIIFSFLLFICYKYKLRLDIITYTLFVVFLVTKVCFYIFLQYIYNTNNTQMLNTLFLYSDINGFVQNHPMYNINYYLIGIYFGILNYTFQKGIYSEIIEQTGFTYLYHFANIVKGCQKRKTLKYWLVLIFTIIINISLLMYYSIVSSKFTSSKDFFENRILNYFMLFDGELYVILVFLTFFVLCLSSGFLISIFSHEYWGIISKTYFMVILNLSPALYFIFYESESRISLELFNILFFFLFTFIIVLLFSIFLYVVLEISSKKLSFIIVNSLFKKGNVEDETGDSEKIASENEYNNLTMFENDMSMTRS